MIQVRDIVGLLLAAPIVAGCGNGRLDPGGGPTEPLPSISFVTTDLSTGTRVATVQVYAGLDGPSAHLVTLVASQLRVATWPDDSEVTTTQVINLVQRAILPNGAESLAYGEIQKQLNASVDASAWHAIRLAPQAATYSLPSEANAFAFDGGARGVRFSPAHAPVVASVMSCAKDAGVVAVYARYSEPVVRAAGAVPLLDYGIPPAGCTLGGDSAVETQFICSNAGSGDQPLWLEIPAGVTAQASGAAMAPGRLDSTAMQTSTTNDGCTVHKPLTVDQSASQK
jgi:hypothetical protein